MVEVTFGELTYPLTVWARVLSESYHTLYYRHRRGWPAEEVLFGRERRPGRQIDINGWSRTISEWSEVTETPTTTIYHRLRAGWSEVEAVRGKEQKQV